ncbi:hypothetical protein LOD99_4123 [Oopsacas minuta]|uniref:Ig-like domain-containing protein n=1 Tax=Oopsacas minuta TaxID=111878 RepID=A0AAV7JVB1_9METZ|nr:hypothetical protein LOD99_4123 [Oopsacas minuta]
MFTGAGPIVLFLLFLIPCYLSQSVTINISPDTIYVDSNATITCIATANDDTLVALVPFYVINGTHVQHSCIGSTEYEPLTQNFSTLPFVPIVDSTLSTRISLSPVSESDDGLSIGCVFYNLTAESIASSNVLTLSVLFPTSGPNISDVNTTATFTEVPFLNSRSFHITIGSIGGVIGIVVIIAILLILIIALVVCAVKRSKRRKPSTTEGIVAHNLSTTVTPITAATPKEEPDELIKSRTNSIKAQNDKEFASRYSALPTYSVAVSTGGDELSASTDPNLPHHFTSIDDDVQKEKL